ncbi:MAG: subtilase family serine protease [Psychromonas sp.]|jgi:subtilase family serine protease|uniref:hypothetical protein n=1 Tax=Psychromonas sp. TaxID=1884585 RepID=UPI0039E59595
MKLIKHSIAIISLTIAISACSVNPEYGISGAYADINQMQILDPMAPENNSGVVNSLEGNLAKKVITGYQSATYSAKEGRVVPTLE